MTQIQENRGVRVLVVDDYRPFADLLVGVLFNHGYEAYSAYSAEEAISTAETFAPHALVLDVLLPDRDGFEVAKECEQRFPACRVLLTSAWDYEGEPGEQPERFKVVRKSDIMEMLFEFLEECSPPQ